MRKAASICTLLREGCWARNVDGGESFMELIFGRRPPDFVTLENANPAHRVESPRDAHAIVNEIRNLALASNLKALCKGSTQSSCCELKG